MTSSLRAICLKTLHQYRIYSMVNTDTTLALINLEKTRLYNGYNKEGEKRTFGAASWWLRAPLRSRWEVNRGSSWSMDGCSKSKHRGWAGQVMEGNGEDVQISNGGGGVIEGGGWPHGWRSPHLGGLVTGGSGQSTHLDEWRDGHGHCIVSGGATSSWTLSREVILYWLCRSAVGGGVVQGIWRGSGGVQGIWLDPQQPGLRILPIHL
jgi:hypothetical protein